MKSHLIAIIALLIMPSAACTLNGENLPPTASAQVSNQALSGNWKIITLNGAQIAQNLRTANLRFDAQNISGTAFCNNYSGQIIGKSPTISFGPVISTEMACMENKLMEQEAQFHAMLAEVKSLTQNGNELSFMNQSGEVIAVFQKSNN